jgi:hypothetical protein
MIRVTIELIPMGIEANRRHLGTIEIANDGTGTATHGNYMTRFSKSHRPTSTWKREQIMGFPRKRLGPYDLLLRALVMAVGERNDLFGQVMEEECI